ncbi:MAG: PorP/SprF family type IX secretion system membrane protein [Bacteroidota bacterium]|nr:PorP/SprF family type IX secretion system membrane protein [Bacteroidota bacterium]
MRKFYFTFILSILSLAAIAQQLPIYNQYFNNPYIYNPAFAGSQNAAYIYLNHKQQWMGIEGAPVTSSFSFNTPAGRRAALGMNIYTDKRGLLKTSSALASFGYTVPLGYNHFVRFGISAGLGSNSIDFAQVDNIQDPAVLKLLTDNIFLDGQFGINYQIKNLNLGFALPKLYENEVFSEDYFSDLKVGRLKRYLFSGSYKINLGPSSSLEPQALYRMTQGLPDLMEGGLILNLKEVMWLGGSYRMGYGATALAGIRIKDNISLGYAYEFATAISSNFVGGSHEVQLGIRLGKHKDPNRKKDAKPVKEPEIAAIEEPKKEEIATKEQEEAPKPIVVEKPIEKPVEKPKEKSIEKQIENPVEKQIEKTIEKPIVKAEEKPIVKEVIQPVVKSKPLEITVKKGKHPLELEKGSYVIAGVYSNEKNAQKFRDAVKERGYKASYGYNSENNLFYVFIHSSEDKEATKEELMKYREKHEFKDSWLLTVESEASPAPSEAPGVRQEVKESFTPEKPKENSAPIKNEVQPEKVKENTVPKEVKETNIPKVFKGPQPDDIEFSQSFHEEALNIIVEEGQVLTVQKGNMQDEMDRGYYIIAAVYKEKDKAQTYSDKLFKAGTNSKVGYNSVKKYYYIYLVQSKSEETAQNERLKYSQNSRLKEAWILKIE